MPMWKRQEIQEMLRGRRLKPALAVLALALAAAPAQAAVWPEKWGEHTRSKAAPVAIADPALWAEYEGEEAETASFKSPIGPFRATAWRLRDSTSALAWFYATRPVNCTPIRNAKAGCTTPGLAALAIKNYVFLFEGWRPLDRELAELEKNLPNVRSGGGLPNLPRYLPDKNLVRNSERFIIGVESLLRFESRISPMLVGFEDGAEAMTAAYKTPSGEIPVTLLSYPTPQIARVKLDALEKQQGWSVKRSGTLIAVIPQQVDPKVAAAVLDPIAWDVNFMWNEATKAPPMPDVAGMLIAIFELTGFLLVVCIGGGVVLAGLRIFLRSRERAAGVPEGTITILDLSD
jgi:hypothetical protein